jgi:hypothetical protein
MEGTIVRADIQLAVFTRETGITDASVVQTHTIVGARLVALYPVTGRAAPRLMTNTVSVSCFAANTRAVFRTVSGGETLTHTAVKS